MSPPPSGSTALLDREAELEQVMAIIEAARDGRGGLVLVEGPAGVGKSAVLAQARGHATRAGMRVLVARGAELEREWAFGIARQIFEPALAGISAADRRRLLQGAAGRAAALLDLPGAESQQRAGAVDASFAVLHGLYWLGANLSAEQPLCVVVDDAHWSDASSLRALAFLLPRLDELSIAMVVASRPPEDESAAAVLAVMAAGAGEVVRPSPLSLEAVAKLVEVTMSAPCEPEFAAACHRATGGIPFLVAQLATTLRDEGVTPEAASIDSVERQGARDVGRWLLTRLRRMPPSAERLARAVGILETASLQQAAALAELETGDAQEGADLLASADVLARDEVLRFAHPLLRAGVLSELHGWEKAQLHRRAAEILAQGEVAGERVAEHLLLSEPAGDSKVVEHLRAAATAATQTGAPESAVSYLARALAEPPDEDSRTVILMELGVAEVSAGWARGIQRLEAAAADEGPARFQAAMALGAILARQEQTEEAIAVVQGALDLVPPDDDETAELIDVTIASIAMLAPGVAARHRERIAAARMRAGHSGASRELLGLAALVAVETNEPTEAAAELARRSVAASSDPWAEPESPVWFQQVAVTLVWAECDEEAEQLLGVALEHAARVEDLANFAGLSAYRAWLRLAQGRPREAEADVRTALDAGALLPGDSYHPMVTGALVEALVETGDLGEAEAALAEIELTPRGSQMSATVWLARGRLRAAQGRWKEALLDMLTAGEIALDTAAASPCWLAWRSEAALARLELGQPEQATVLATDELELARQFGAPRTLGRALRAAARCEGARSGEKLLRESITTLERGGAALDLARAQLDLAAILDRTNRRAEARELMRAALDVADRQGARPLADSAEVALRGTGAKPRRTALTGAAALTASERRVAELAAEGQTNREIGEALFVTARTAEGHLTRAFRKLGVRSREELAGAL